MRKYYGPKWWKITQVVFILTNISFNAHGDFVNIENDSWKNSEVMNSDAQWASPITIKIENGNNYRYSCLRGSNMSYEKFMGSRSFI